MPQAAKKNLHVPLPPELYAELRTRSERLGAPATTLAREAIEDWLQKQREAEIAREIRAYAEAVAGSEDDLDEELAKAGEEHLLAAEE